MPSPMPLVDPVTIAALPLSMSELPLEFGKACGIALDGFTKVVECDFPIAEREVGDEVLARDDFQNRQALAGLVIVMDIRHPLREFDLKMLDYARSRGLPAHCLLTKADKLGRGAQGNTLLGVRKDLGPVASVQLFSSETKLGIDEARAVVTKWLHG